MVFIVEGMTFDYHCVCIGSILFQKDPKALTDMSCRAKNKPKTGKSGLMDHFCRAIRKKWTNGHFQKLFLGDSHGSLVICSDFWPSRTPGSTICRLIFP